MCFYWFKGFCDFLKMIFDRQSNYYILTRERVRAIEPNLRFAQLFTQACFVFLAKKLPHLSLFINNYYYLFYTHPVHNTMIIIIVISIYEQCACAISRMHGAKTISCSECIARVNYAQKMLLMVGCVGLKLNSASHIEYFPPVRRIADTCAIWFA